MDQEQRAFRGLPAGVVENDGENRKAVAAGDPVDGAGDGEEVGAVANDLGDEARGTGGKSEAEGCAAYEMLVSSFYFTESGFRKQNA